MVERCPVKVLSEIYRALIFVKFKNIMFPKQLMGGMGLSQTPESIPERRLLWSVFKQSAPAGAPDPQSMNDMVKTIFIQGLGVPIVDSYLDDEGFTHFIFMGRVDDVYKTMTWLQKLSYYFLEVNSILGVNRISEDKIILEDNALLYVNNNPKYWQNNVNYAHIEYEKWVTLYESKYAGYGPVNKDLAEHFVQVMDTIPQYVFTLLSLTSPEHCKGFLAHVGNILKNNT
jgi:hypothetical protein